MNALLFSNKQQGWPLTLFLSITLDLKALEFQGETEKTCIQLDFIEVDFRSFSDIENKAFEFPVNPEDGYIDGSVYLDGQHIPVDVNRIKFLSFDGNDIQAEFSGKVLFGYCGYQDSDQDFMLSARLRFDHILIPPDIISAGEQNLDMANNMMSEFFDISELSEPVIENNGFRDAIVFHKSVSH